MGGGTGTGIPNKKTIRAEKDTETSLQLNCIERNPCACGCDDVSYHLYSLGHWNTAKELENSHYVELLPHNWFYVF